ncbi:hypothetical protein WICPIJ_002167 [Wickerhamomyces pijperi]|uniref:Uncharacterized protein n=1 Tax=Wickerhamomyces pijperi TaxID=599730 RepID=A0A9P8TQ21_WICPI|nr:hypothetical protein WICPIJ_002167 [Wickerhamomyces pijperi]
MLSDRHSDVDVIQIGQLTVQPFIVKLSVIEIIRITGIIQHQGSFNGPASQVQVAMVRVDPVTEGQVRVLWDHNDDVLRPNVPSMEISP